MQVPEDARRCQKYKEIPMVMAIDGNPFASGCGQQTRFVPGLQAVCPRATRPRCCSGLPVSQLHSAPTWWVQRRGRQPRRFYYPTRQAKKCRNVSTCWILLTMWYQNKLSQENVFLALRPGMMEITKMHERLRANPLFSDPSSCHLGQQNQVVPGSHWNAFAEENFFCWGNTDSALLTDSDSIIIII